MADSFNTNHEYKVEFFEYDDGRPCIEVTPTKGKEKPFTITISCQEDENAPDCELDEFAKHLEHEPHGKLTLLDNALSIPQCVLDKCLDVVGVTWADPWNNGGCKFQVADAKYPVGTVMYV